MTDIPGTGEINALKQDCSNSIANALELLQWLMTSCGVTAVLH